MGGGCGQQLLQPQQQWAAFQRQASQGSQHSSSMATAASSCQLFGSPLASGDLSAAAAAQAQQGAGWLGAAPTSTAVPPEHQQLLQPQMPAPYSVGHLQFGAPPQQLKHEQQGVDRGLPASAFDLAATSPYSSAAPWGAPCGAPAPNGGLGAAEHPLPATSIELPLPELAELLDDPSLDDVYFF